ncbi:MAG: J domain-containing protein [Microcoleus sp. PH2017_10_PVI_O_A]|uniref:J domain-containing protein n=1 Tax=unclassified Microcoleus TaxID=2642155 RepID=UPI001D7D81FD|nr:MULTISPECIES: J domain-containing protein [unclassified Microcoleus]TAE85197.1 MAG: J domain-containing protein [Oscillatoriales cyanobacterium]MCC3405879.1 J domain-containing protein [Microcoleus sp. PH2017_10_PVI_O_A]MCC3460448.1 J domain-containing protein [Microcoleus sp. PH2017_11_PCY_U_A]MCC3478741.1 J domain-containing protein [Microcoleus sp. PH2017_12_PCY_D_A]MCC3528857.1 J domain-containing protein [Microcoleus sp. PH2017_21_RUC_O_A]
MADINRCYEILEIEPGASLEEIKRAYRDLAFVWHPDRFVHNDRLQQKAQQRLTEINQAYDELVLFLSQPPPQAIDKQSQQPAPPPPAEKPPEKPLRRRSAKSARKPGSQRTQTRQKKAASHKISTPNNPKNKKRFTTQNRQTWGGKKQSGPTAAREARPSQKYPYLTPNRKKEFPTQYSQPRLSQKYSSFPWGPLTLAVASYALTGWILTVFAAPLWMWTLICGADWLWAAILLAEGSATPRVWLAALVLAGTVGGSIAGFQAGGTLTGAAWALVGAGLGAIASSEAESRAVAVVLAAAGVLTVVGLMAGTGSGNWLKVLVEAVCWGIVGLMCGLAAELGLHSGCPVGLGGAIGLGIGAWAGALTAAGSGDLAQALAIAGSQAVYGAWAAIGIIAGVVARMVAGERSIGIGGGLYTSILLVTTSGFGLWLGRWLVGRSHLFN